MGLAVGTKNTFPPKPGLLDSTDRGLVIGCRLSVNTAEAQVLQAPGRGQAKSLRCDTTPSRLRKHGDSKPRDFLVVELEIEKPERSLVGRICDHKGRSTTPAPLILGSGNTVALSIRRERLVVESSPGLWIEGCVRYQRYICLSA
jgi:hypothetical protein